MRIRLLDYLWPPRGELVVAGTLTLGTSANVAIDAAKQRCLPEQDPPVVSSWEFTQTPLVSTSTAENGSGGSMRWQESPVRYEQQLGVRFVQASSRSG